MESVGRLCWLAFAADAPQQVVTALGFKLIGQRHGRNRYLVEAVDVLARRALEMHVIVEVRVGAALNRAGGVPDNIRQVAHPVH
jgi:hypothetical protein